MKRTIKLKAAIRKAYIGVPESTNTERLYSLGIHNTLDEIAEAQRISQLERLSMTRPGRRILEKLRIQYDEQGAKTPVPDEIRTKIRVDAIPRNVHPENNEGIRKAKAVADLHAGDMGARYVDAAEYANRRGFAVAVVDAGWSIRAAASTTSSTPKEAEEVAIALAIKDPGCSTVFRDSRQAIRNFARGRVYLAATKILKVIARLLKKKRIKWFPAHAGKVSDTKANHNETTHACARELTDRAGSSGEHLWFSTRDKMTRFKAITKAY